MNKEEIKKKEAQSETEENPIKHDENKSDD